MFTLPLPNIHPAFVSLTFKPEAKARCSPKQMLSKLLLLAAITRGIWKKCVHIRTSAFICGQSFQRAQNPLVVFQRRPETHFIVVHVGH
jgi:hypothetical protein